MALFLNTEGLSGWCHYAKQRIQKKTNAALAGVQVEHVSLRVKARMESSNPH